MVIPTAILRTTPEDKSYTYAITKDRKTWGWRFAAWTPDGVGAQPTVAFLWLCFALWATLDRVSYGLCPYTPQGIIPLDPTSTITLHTRDNER